MMRDFLASWPLFYPSYVAALLIGCTLALLGVLVVGRRQVFVAAAISQASLFGIAAGVVWGGATASWWGVGAGIAAAVGIGGRRSGHDARAEELTGWVFLLAASGAVLLLADHPGGTRVLQSASASTIIGARTPDLWMLGTLAALAIAVTIRTHRRLMLLITDPVMAAAIGLAPGAWNLATSIFLGLAAGLAIRVSGMLFTFACLVLPALAARNLCTEIRSMFLISPVIGVGGVLTGLALAHAQDLPPGQTAVAVQAFALALAWIAGGVRRRLCPPPRRSPTRARPPGPPETRRGTPDPATSQPTKAPTSEPVGRRSATQGPVAAGQLRVCLARRGRLASGRGP